METELDVYTELTGEDRKGYVFTIHSKKRLDEALLRSVLDRAVFDELPALKKQ